MVIRVRSTFSKLNDYKNTRHEKAIAVADSVTAYEKFREHR